MPSKKTLSSLLDRKGYSAAALPSGLVGTLQPGELNCIYRGAHSSYSSFLDLRDEALYAINHHAGAEGWGVTIATGSNHDYKWGINRVLECSGSGAPGRASASGRSTASCGCRWRIGVSFILHTNTVQHPEACPSPTASHCTQRLIYLTVSAVLPT